MDIKNKIISTEHFNSSEFIYSSTADRYKISNIPTDVKVIENLNNTITRMEDIRTRFGKPIYINSGYRCPELNQKVGGKPNSQHLKGEAADLRFDIDLLNFIIQFCHFDQLIIEKSKNSKWLHISFKIDKDKERNQVLNITV